MKHCLSPLALRVETSIFRIKTYAQPTRIFSPLPDFSTEQWS